MTTRENIIEALNGGMPQRIPLTVYEDDAGRLISPEMRSRCFEQGLGVIRHAFDLVEWIQHDVRITQQETEIAGKIHKVIRYETPVGSLEQVHVDGWHHEYFIKEDSDYDVMRWIVEHTEVRAAPERMVAHLEVIGEQGICMPAGFWSIGDQSETILWEALRSPFMKMCVDWVDMQKFCMDAALETPEMIALYEAMRVVYRKTAEALTQCSAPFVKLFENLTIPMIGPARYSEFLSPVYNEWAEIFEPTGKKLCVHFDGQLGAVKNQIAAERFSIIESLTEPPEGNMTYDECRAAWPDKVFWANLRADTFLLKGDELKEEIRGIVSRAGRKGLLLEFAEHLPENGDEVVSVILEVLNEDF